MFTIDNKVFRNLQEQVLKNQEDIKYILEEEGTLNEFGIKVVNEAKYYEQLPDTEDHEVGEVIWTTDDDSNKQIYVLYQDPDTSEKIWSSDIDDYKSIYENWEYGDTIALQNEESEDHSPYYLKTLTRANISQLNDYWFNIGIFPKPGPQGQTGETGATGQTGQTGIGINSATLLSTVVSGEYTNNTIRFTLTNGENIDVTVQSKNGSQGSAGQGLASGGRTGSFLIKKSDTNYDTEFTDSSSLKYEKRIPGSTQRLDSIRFHGNLFQTYNQINTITKDTIAQCSITVTDDVMMDIFNMLSNKTWDYKSVYLQPSGGEPEGSDKDLFPRIIFIKRVNGNVYTRTSYGMDSIIKNNNIIFNLPNKTTGTYTLATLDDIQGGGGGSSEYKEDFYQFTETFEGIDIEGKAIYRYDKNANFTDMIVDTPNGTVYPGGIAIYRMFKKLYSGGNVDITAMEAALNNKVNYIEFHRTLDFGGGITVNVINSLSISYINGVDISIIRVKMKGTDFDMEDSEGPILERSLGINGYYDDDINDWIYSAYISGNDKLIYDNITLNSWDPIDKTTTATINGSFGHYSDKSELQADTALLIQPITGNSANDYYNSNIQIYDYEQDNSDDSKIHITLKCYGTIPVNTINAIAKLILK